MSKANAGTKVETSKVAPSNKGAKVKGSKKSKGRVAAGELVGKVVQASEGHAARMTMFDGVSACKILKWMGERGWSRKEASVVATHLWPSISGSTIGCQFYSGRAKVSGNTPTHSGSSADLSKEQVGELEALKVKLTSK